jgi:PAS domain S-box-containing protein
MRNRKFYTYIIFTGLGFLAAIVIGLFMFSQFRNVMSELKLLEQESALLERMKNLLLSFIVFIIVFFASQIFSGSKSVLVPAGDLEADERVRVMLNTMAMACYFFDVKANPIDCNQSTVELFFFFFKQEFLDNFYNYSPMFQPDGSRSVEKAKELLQSAFKTGKQVFTWEHMRANGTILATEITLIRVDWKDGYRVVAYTRDLSELKETADNFQRLFTISEASPNLVLSLGTDANVEYINPAVSAVSGYSKEELMDQGLSLVFSQEDFHRFKMECIVSSVKNESSSFEMTLVSKDGKKSEFLFTVFQAKLHDGNTGAGIIGKDITELKQVQRDLAAAKKHNKS